MGQASLESCNKIKTIFTKNCHATKLGIGVMSKNVVDTVIDVVNETNFPLMLIASRRQIDAKCLGSGYVNGWDTETFSRYVREKDKNNLILLCRDHGGPWQNTAIEKHMSYNKTFISACKSFETDILSDYNIIHIDPSIDGDNSLSEDKTLERLFEFYDFCTHVARKNNKQIIFEVGTEIQSTEIGNLESIKYFTEKILSFCDKQNFSRPHFIVAQVGTLVKGKDNIGAFNPDNQAHFNQVRKIVKYLDQNNIKLKIHNADYLNNRQLKTLNSLGCHSLNVAPEFAVKESLVFLNICNNNNLKNLSESFLTVSFNSKQWEKWLAKGVEYTDYDKAVISGHYVYNTEEFKEIKAKASEVLLKKGINLDAEIQKSLKILITNKLELLGYFR